VPTVPSNNKCKELGCNNTRSLCNTLCLLHGGYDTYKATPNNKRKEFNKQYQSKYWIKVRAIQLNKEPLCQCCKLRGRVTQATEVDHLFPWSRLHQEAFYQSSLQSLCASCHRYKTMLEAKGICRHFHAFGAIDYALDDYNQVVKKP